MQLQGWTKVKAYSTSSSKSLLVISHSCRWCKKRPSLAPLPRHVRYAARLARDTSSVQDEAAKRIVVFAPAGRWRRSRTKLVSRELEDQLFG